MCARESGGSDRYAGGAGRLLTLPERYRPSHTSAGQSLPARLALVAPFLLLLAVNSWHHVLWGDELHAWGIVTGSADLREMFGNLHYDGHPGLWHLMLWPGRAVTSSPAWMRLVAFAVGTAIVLTIGLAAPFSLAEKTLLLLNYYIVFEYTVMVRNYGIGLLLAMFYAIVRTSARHIATREGGVDPRAPGDAWIRSLLIGLLLGLMANANVYALFLSGFLALEYAWSQSFEWARPARADLIRLLPGGLLFVALVLFSAWTFFPPADIGHSANALKDRDPDTLRRLAVAALRTLVAPFVPIDLSFPDSFAFPGNWYERGKRVTIMAVLLPFVLAAQWTVLRHRKPLALALAGTAATATLFAFLFWPAAIRHLGALWTGFIVAWWLVRDRLPARSWPMLALLTVGALGGVAAQAGQWMRPFSTSAAVATWIRENGYAETATVGDWDWGIEPVAVLLRHPFYSVDCQCTDRFATLRHRDNGYNASMLPDRLAQYVETSGQAPFLLLLEARLDPESRAAIVAKRFKLTEVAYFSGAERDKEMAIYRVDRTPR